MTAWSFSSYIAGMKHSEETKRKISASMKGKSLGVKRSPEAIEKCRQSLLKAHADGKFKHAKYRGSRHFLGKKHSEATKAKMRDARLKNQPMHRSDVVARVSKTKKELGVAKGANNPNWKGGITKEQIRIRNSNEYAQWRTAVFVRDEYTCQDCGAKCEMGLDVKLNAHHIRSFSKHPELRLELSNGITLCKPCHDKIPKGNQHYAYN